MLDAKLKVVGGKQDGKMIPLPTGKKFLIGRERDCQLRPTSESVSRHHCVLSLDDYNVLIRDLGSTNGTSVNGERIHGQVPLKSGDTISVGKLTFEVVVEKKAAAAQPDGAAGGLPTGEQATSETQFEIPAATDQPTTSTPVPTSDSAILSEDTTIIPPAGGNSPTPAHLQQPQETQPGAAPPQDQPQQGQGLTPEQQQMLDRLLQQQQQYHQQAAAAETQEHQVPTEPPPAASQPQQQQAAPPVQLPPPESTGANDDEDEEEAAAKADEEQPKEPQVNPAEEIIRRYRNRR